MVEGRAMSRTVVLQVGSHRLAQGWYRRAQEVKTSVVVCHGDTDRRYDVTRTPAKCRVERRGWGVKYIVSTHFQADNEHVERPEKNLNR